MSCVESKITFFVTMPSMVLILFGLVDSIAVIRFVKQGLRLAPNVQVFFWLWGNELLLFMSIFLKNNVYFISFSLL